MKYMNIEKFMKLGYLQEANRKFFHPLGLALVAEYTSELRIGRWVIRKGRWSLKGIWDNRNDPEGIIFADGVMTKDKKDNVSAANKDIARLRKLGYVIQPID